MRHIAPALLLLLSSANSAFANSIAPNCLLHPAGRIAAFIVFCYTVMPLFRLLKQYRDKKPDAMLRRQVLFKIGVIVLLVALPYAFTGSCGDPRLGD